MLTYLLKGGPSRRTRLHNCRGDLLDARGLLYLPQCVSTTIWLKLTGRRPVVPWLGYRAIKFLDRLIEPSSKILEFGSGMSTIWFARRCDFVVSLETDARWFVKVEGVLEREGVDNVDHRLCPVADDGGAPDYGAALSDHAGTEFDLVLVDGYRRDAAMAVAIAMVRPDGSIFLDNTDLPNDELRVAERMLRDAVGEDSKLRVFNDLCPTLVKVNEGVLGRVSR